MHSLDVFHMLHDTKGIKSVRPTLYPRCDYGWQPKESKNKSLFKSCMYEYTGDHKLRVSFRFGCLHACNCQLAV